MIVAAVLILLKPPDPLYDLRLDDRFPNVSGVFFDSKEGIRLEVIHVLLEPVFREVFINRLEAFKMPSYELQEHTPQGEDIAGTRDFALLRVKFRSSVCCGPLEIFWGLVRPRDPGMQSPKPKVSNN